MMRRLVTSLLVACALSAAAPVVAAAQSSGSAQQALTDCNDHGALTGHYSADALRNALASMPADMREYTDCYDVIEKQLFAQLGTSSSSGSGGSGSSSGGSVLPTWLIVVIVVLALAALTFGALAIRRRRLEMTDAMDAGGSDSPSEGGPPAPSGEERSDDPGGSGPSGGA
jgi:cytochrome c biogenesis protein CcdA